MKHYAVLLSAVLLASCVTPPPPVEKPVPKEPEAPEVKRPDTIDGHIRLGTDVVPKRYDLTLRIDPRSETFSGQVEIEIDIIKPTWFVQLHGGDLTIDSASIETTDKHDATVIQGENGGMVLQSPVKLASGVGTLRIKFQGGLGEVPESLYRVKEGEGWYAYTQFEPLEARDAFPSFDDPGFKTPYAVTLEVPKGITALANTPETERKDDGDWTAYHFAVSKPLPTYLVAFAVGEFDIVEAKEGVGQNKVPLRIITTKGKGHLTDFVLETTPPILASLEKYFGSPYPFEKLDLVAVPNFAAGAMENVGLVTYRETLLLFDAKTAPVRTRYRSISVNAHELAHMWFGNLVTLAWWDDLWLNEAFATWMASRTVADVAPELQADLDAVRRANGVMDQDAREATRSIRQPITHGGDVYNAFDGITYSKGASVLAMIETWTGEDAFRSGVRSYLGANAYGSARTDDLLEALEVSSGKPVRATLGTFIDQPGTPFLTVDVQCADDAVSVALSQTRYLPAGSNAPVGEPWRVPVCMKYESGGKVHKTCVELDTAQKTFPLDVKECPTWLHPNADERGYYRWKLPGDRMRDLATKHRSKLSLRERIALPQHLGALLQADAVSADVYLTVNQALGAEEHRLIVGSMIGNLGFIDRRVIGDKQRKKFEAYVKKMVKPHLGRVGLRAKPGESAEVALLRPSLLSTMVYMGGDKKLRRILRDEAKKFMKNPDSVRPDLARLAIGLVARDGDAALWEKMKAGVLEAKTPLVRSIYLRGLGGFHDPELAVRSYELLLDGTLRGQDYWSIIGPGFATDATHATMWTWITKNYDRIIEALGDKRAHSIPWAATGYCSNEGVEATKAFFADPDRTPPGTERNLAQAIESIELCARLKKSMTPGVEKFFN
jgi:cytosol alanyl aminopeptidase